MIVKPAKFKKEKRIVDVRVSNDIYGCDQCKKEFEENREYLQYTIHFQEGEAERHEFCSWKCVLKSLKKVKTDYFVSMPFLHYDKGTAGTRAKDFLKAIKTPTE